MTTLAQEPTLHELIASMTDAEKAELKERWYGEPKPFMGQRIHFWFPEKYNLKEFSTVGQVPRVGDCVYVQTWITYPKALGSDRNYNKYRRWKVKQVDWSVRVPGNRKEDLVGNVSYDAEVHLVLSDWGIKTKFWRKYWAVKHWLRDTFRPRKT